MGRQYFDSSGSVINETGARQYVGADGNVINETSGGAAEVSADLTATYNVSNYVSADLAASYSLLDASTVSSSLVASYGVAAFVSQDLTGAYSVLTGAAAGTFLSDAWIGNADLVWAPGTAVYWTWTTGGRVGAMTGKAITEGVGTLNAASKLALTGLPAGAGKLDGAVRGATAADDYEYSQHGTVT